MKKKFDKVAFGAYYNALPEDEIGAGLVSFAIESAKHETMYSRIYRN